MTNTRPMTAGQAYGSHYASILAIVESLPAALGNMAADAQRVNWGHVGDLAQVAHLAAALRDAINSVTEAHSNAR